MTDMKPYPSQGRAAAQSLRTQAVRLRARADEVRAQLDAANEAFGAALARDDAKRTTADRITELARGARKLGAQR